MVDNITRSVSLQFLKAYRQLYVDGHVKNKTDFCKRVGLFQSNYSRIEKGELQCTVTNISQLSSALNVSLDWLFFNSGNFYKDDASAAI